MNEDKQIEDDYKMKEEKENLLQLATTNVDLVKK